MRWDEDEAKRPGFIVYAARRRWIDGLPQSAKVRDVREAGEPDLALAPGRRSTHERSPLTARKTSLTARKIRAEPAAPIRLRARLPTLRLRDSPLYALEMAPLSA
jgi:hypothetical protein